MAIPFKQRFLAPSLVLGHIRELERLIFLNRKIAMQVDLDGVLQAIVDCARDLIGANMGGLVVVDTNGTNQLRHFKVSGVPPSSTVPAGHGLFMAPYRTRKPIRVKSVKTHGTPTDHPHIGPFLGVPLEAGATPLGSLFLAETPGGRPFTARDQSLLSAFADQSAIAIDSAQTREHLSRLLVLEERERISHALHASVAQNLFLLKLEIGRLSTMVGPNSPDMAEGVRTMNDLADESLKDVRQAIHSLSDSLFRRQRISVTLKRMIEEFQHTAHIDTTLIVRGNDAALGEDINLTIAQIVEESLTNVRKHSESKTAVISVTVGRDSVIVAVQDAGVGLPIQVDLAQSYGLHSMQSLVAKLFGTFEALTNDEGGTTVRATLPIDGAS